MINMPKKNDMKGIFIARPSKALEVILKLVITTSIRSLPLAGIRP